MKRLFAFGCSLTYYSWPTWADLISTSFDEYYNFAVMGMGNQFIHHTVYEANSIFDFTSNDTVLVMFTHPFRNDSFIIDPLDKNLRWQSRGFIYQPSNDDLYTDEWRKYFWSPEQSYMQQWLTMKSIKELLLRKGVNYKFLSGISHRNTEGTGPIDSNEHGFIQPYYKQIDEMLDVNESLFEWANKNYKKEDFYVFNGELDQHPTVTMHGNYALKFLPEFCQNLTENVLAGLEAEIDFNSQENNWKKPKFMQYRGKKAGSVMNWLYSITNKVEAEQFKN